MSNKLKILIEQIVEQELSEMPVANYKTIGDFSKKYSISHPVDRRLLSNPKAIEKITRQWEKTPFKFDLYVINDKRVMDLDFRETGSVNVDKFIRAKMKLTPDEVPNPTPGHITVLYISNSGDERYMATGWILAHRFGHAIARSQDESGEEWRRFREHLREVVSGILETVYGVSLENKNYENAEAVLLQAAQQLGSMKSARDNNLRNWAEFAYELLAQYMLTGSIKLNPLPEKLIVGLRPFGRKDTRVAHDVARNMYNNHDLDYYAGELESMLDTVLSKAVNKVYVM